MHSRTLVLLVLTLFACGAAERDGVEAPTAQPAVAHSDDRSAIVSVASRHNERPLPNFGGRTLDGGRVLISDLIGKRLLLFFFNPEIEDAKPVARAVNDVAALRGRHNFAVLGVAIGSDSVRVAEFARELAIDFPVIDDSDGQITRQLNLRAALSLLIADKEGYLEFALGNFDPVDPEGMAQTTLYKQLRIPAKPSGASGALQQWPMAPDFSAPWLAGGEPFHFADHAGKPAVLIFFLHTCPHCHKALEFLKTQLADLPEDQRPLLIAISAVDRGSEITRALREKGLDFFPVLLDPDQKIQAEYGVFGGFPDVLLIDKQGRIVHRVQGWHDGRDPALVRMKLAKMSDARVPMLLNPRGYTGSDVCGVCHQTEHAAWQFTRHANAFDTLVTHGANRNEECISCHVVGFQQSGGFDLTERPAHLEDVGCESCHGRGGPHLSPAFVKESNYAPVCEGCHNPKHSLGFDYAAFRPSISHAAIAALSDGERSQLLAGRKRPGELLPTSADYVGSQACASCHAKEFATWAASPHAAAGKTLEAKQQGANSECLACHTTGFAKTGGFAEGGHIEEGSDLSRVGCESCHGPGGDHIKADAPKIGSVVSLGDKCDSCVILKICGNCHDSQNDPGFEFEVQDKIDLQRHGTTEAGSSKKL